jgi:hypothetical protein
VLDFAGCMAASFCAALPYHAPRAEPPGAMRMRQQRTTMRAYGRAQAVQCAAVLHRVLHPLKDAERADRRGLARHARRTSLRHAPRWLRQRCIRSVARQVARCVLRDSWHGGTSFWIALIAHSWLSCCSSSFRMPSRCWTTHVPRCKARPVRRVEAHGPVSTM